MAERLLITGATGYLGRFVAREFLDAGYKVGALVRDPARLGPDLAGRVEVRRGDLLEPSSLDEAVRGVDGVIHLAGLVSDWAPDRRLYHLVNVEGTRNLLAAVRAAGVPRFLLTSTVMVFGPSDGLEAANEGTPPPARRFFLPYQVTKARALALARAARSDALDVRVVFPGALYGAGALTDGNYLARVMGELRRGAFPFLPDTRGRRWCLAHVEDVAVGHRLVLERGGRDFEGILGGDNVTFDAMLDVIRDGLGLSRLPPRVPGWVMLSGLPFMLLAAAIAGERPPITMGGARALLHDWAFSSAKAHREVGYAWRSFEAAFPPFVSWFAGLREGLAPALAAP